MSSAVPEIMVKPVRTMSWPRRFLMVGLLAVVGAFAIAAPGYVIWDQQRAIESQTTAGLRSDMAERRNDAAMQSILTQLQDQARLLKKSDRRIIKILDKLRIDCAGDGLVLNCRLIAPTIVTERVVTEAGEIRIIRRIICRLPNGKKCPFHPTTTP
jgi:hypothetical protein